MQPFDYRIAVQDPLQMALAGYQQGQQFQNQRVQAERETQLYDMEMQQYQANQAKLQEEQARAKQFHANLADMFERVDAGTWSEGDTGRFLAENSEIGEHTAAYLQSLSEEQKMTGVRDQAKLLMMLNNEPGPPSEDSQVAMLLKERKAAAEAAGKPDQVTAADEMLREYLNTPAALKASLMTSLAITDPKVWAVLEPLVVQKAQEVPAAVQTFTALAELAGIEPGTPEYARAAEEAMSGGGQTINVTDIFGKGAARGGEVFKIDPDTGEIVSVAIEGGDLDTQRTNAIAAADLMLNNLNAILEDEGAPSRYGMSSIGGRIPPLPGTPGARAQARINQLGGQVFISAYEALKGGGSITNIETEKAERAITILLDQNIGWTDAQAALKDLADVVTAQKSRLEKANKSPATTGALTPAAGTTVVPEAAARYGITPEIWANMTPDKKAAFED